MIGLDEEARAAIRERKQIEIERFIRDAPLREIQRQRRLLEAEMRLAAMNIKRVW